MGIRRKLVIEVAVLMIFGAALVAAQQYPTVSFRDAGNHVEKIVWVEGTVLRTAAVSEGTYLYFSNDRKLLAVLIPSSYLGNFKGNPGQMYGSKKIKAFGKVKKEGTQLMLVVDGPKKIKVVEKPAS